jgi:hypothetical protein
MVERLLDRFGSLPGPEELKERSRNEEGLLTPTQQMRAVRELEPPSLEEGFARVERVGFTRQPDSDRTGVGVFVAAPALPRLRGLTDPTLPHLIFDWRPESRGDVEAPDWLTGPAEVAVCPHGGGPPICWCRPPLPGLPLAFACRHRVDPARSLLVGTSPAHRTLATTLGAAFVDA